MITFLWYQDHFKQNSEAVNLHCWYLVSVLHLRRYYLNNVKIERQTLKFDG